MSASQNLKIKVGAKVGVLARTKVISYMGREFCALTGADESTLRIVAEGFNDGLLEQVEIELFASGTEEVVGYIVFRVDWDQHALILGQGGAKQTFAIDPAKPITQVSEILASTSAYLQEQVQRLGKVRPSAVYRAVSGRQEEFRARFKTTPIDNADRDRLDRSRAEFLKVRPSDFPEITVEGGFRTKT